MKRVILSMLFLSCMLRATAQNVSLYWSLSGNNNASTSSRLGTTNSIPLRFFTQNLERIRVDAIGRVGIGTTAPTNKLQVVGTSLFTTTMTVSNGGIVVKNTAGTALDANGSLYGVNSQGGSYGVFGYSLNGKGIFGSSTNNYGVYGVGAFAGVYGSSNFGDGVDGSSTKGVGVHGSGAVFGVSGVNTSNASGYANNAGVYGQTTLDQGIAVLGYADAPAANGVYAYSTQSYGLAASSGKPQGWAAYFTGNTFATGTYQGSDSLLKKNISELNSGLDIISKLHPKSYTFRQDGKYSSMHLPDGKHYGLIAQDVEKVLPNLVKAITFNTRMGDAPAVNNPQNMMVRQIASSAENIDFKALNYTELIPIVIKAVQELSTQNDQKDSVIKDLQNQLNDLKTLVLKQSNPNVMSTIDGYLKQNIPNPANGNTKISYFLSDHAGRAQIKIIDAKGATLKVYSISKGAGQLTISNSDLPAGSYTYTLYAGSSIIDSKQMVIVR